MIAIVKTALLWVLAIFFVFAGINHFRTPDFYLRMMPPYIPWHQACVEVSGVAEIALGLLVLYPRMRRVAGWGIIALLVAVFPANLYMFQHPDLFSNFSSTALAMRLPFQAVFIAWTWWVTQ